jgi:hypothetical protein
MHRTGRQGRAENVLWDTSLNWLIVADRIVMPKVESGQTIVPSLSAMKAALTFLVLAVIRIVVHSKSG